MRQFLTSGSARGVRSNLHPYRDHPDLGLGKETKNDQAPEGRHIHRQRRDINQTHIWDRIPFRAC